MRLSSSTDNLEPNINEVAVELVLLFIQTITFIGGNPAEILVRDAVIISSGDVLYQTRKGDFAIE